MEYRALGDTGIRVGVIGLGVEHLKKRSSEYIAGVVERAVDSGVNYFDLVWSFPHVIQGVAKGMGDRDVHLAVHLGSSYRNGKYLKAKTVRSCESTFFEVMKGLKRDKVSIINVSYVKDMKQWDFISKKNGILELAIRLRDEGHGEIVAISTHTLDVVKKAVEHPELRSVMYQVNMANHILTGRDEAMCYCKDNGMGLVAMKPYAAGNLLKLGRKVKFPDHKTGGFKVEFRIPKTLTDIKCLHYSLNQPGVCCVVTGANGVEELDSTLSYLTTTEAEKNYSTELSELVQI